MSISTSNFPKGASAFLITVLVMCTGASAQVENCPNEAGGDCFTATPGIPGCNDATCCELVCETLDFCCTDGWEQVCVDWAFQVCAGCDTCGLPTCGDCFLANGSQYCSDTCNGKDCAGCCQTICAFDSYCCNTDWDAFCVAEAEEFCACEPEQIPVNDNCEDAIDIGEGVFEFSTVCGTHDGDDSAQSSCWDGFTGITADVWFRYTATITGGVRVNTCGGQADFDAKLAVYDGCVCPLTEDMLIECNDNACGDGSEVIFEVVEGNCYMIRVGGGYLSPSGSGTFTIEPIGAPANDNCASATPINLNQFVQFNNFEATVDGSPSPVCDFNGSNDIDRDVWFSFISPVTSTLQVNTCASGFDTKVAVYEGGECPPVADPIACDDDGCGIQSLVQFEGVKGQTYLFRVGSRPGTDGGGGVVAVTQFGICDADGDVLLDQIGPDFSATAGQGLFASQDFEAANDVSDIAALDDFVVPDGPDVMLSCVDTVAGGFNGFDTTANITSYSLQIYSSPEAAGNDLIGDVASVASVPVVLVDPFDATASTFLFHMDLTALPGPAITLPPGTYWIAVMPSLDFGAGGGQTAISGSTIDGSGNGPNGYQANPAGGFGFPNGLQQIDPPANLAYRVVAGDANPCPWDLDGSGSVGTSDLLSLFAQWGTAGSADFDGSGSVGTADLLILFANWGPCP